MYTYINSIIVSRLLLSAGEISGITQLEESDETRWWYPFSIFEDFNFCPLLLYK